MVRPEERGLDTSFLFAQLLGLSALCLSLYAWQVKDAKNIILCYVPTNLLWAGQFFLLGANVAAYTSLCNAGKDVCLALFPKKYVRLLIGLFIAVIWGVGFSQYTYWYDLLPMLSLTTVNIAYYIDRDNRELMSRSAVWATGFGLTYNLIVGAYFGAICGVLVAASAVIGMRRVECWQLRGSLAERCAAGIKEVFSVARLRTYP